MSKIMKNLFLGILSAWLLGASLPFGPASVSAEDTEVNVGKLSDSAITFGYAKIEVKQGRKKKLNVMFGEDTPDGRIKWKSSNKEVAKVTKKGVIKAKECGTTVITAKIKGTDIKASCEVEVVKYKKYRVRATGYCNCASCSGPGHPRTASGRYPRQGRTLAVDRRMIPLGSKIVMDGHTYYAEDTGGAIKGRRIDVYFHRHSRASRFGVQYKTIKVYYD